MLAIVLPIGSARARMLHKGHLGFIVAWGFCLLFTSDSMRFAPRPA